MWEQHFHENFVNDICFPGKIKLCKRGFFRVKWN